MSMLNRRLLNALTYNQILIAFNSPLMTVGRTWIEYIFDHNIFYHSTTHFHHFFLKYKRLKQEEKVKVRPLVVGVKVWMCDCSPAGYILSLVLLTLPRQHLVKLYLYVLTALLLFAGHQVSRYAVSSPLHLQCFHLTLTAGETASIFLSFTFLLLSTQKNKVFIILVFNSWFSEISVETASSLGSVLDSSVPCDKYMMKWLVRMRRQILTVLRWSWEKSHRIY